MGDRILPGDIAFFSALAAAGSLSAAARELGVTTAAVSKHLAQMEARVGMALVNRTTRRMSLTPEGDILLKGARRVLAEIEAIDQALVGPRQQPAGLLRVNASLGFGRLRVAPVISAFVRQYPEVEVQLQLTVDPPVLTDDAYDLCVRFGAPPDARVIARHVAANRRLLCASPAYLARRGHPQTPTDLLSHDCIGLRQGEDAYGLWRLSSARGGEAITEAVKVRGTLATNDGETAVRWALDGHGILMRAEWDVEPYLASGRLVHVLSDYHTAGADIYAVYPKRHQRTLRVKAFVEALCAALGSPGAP